MILVSITPFAFKKICLLVAALLGLSSAICFADPLFMSTRFMSRDHRSHLTILAAAARTEQPSFETANILQDSTINWLACRSE